MCYYLSHRDDFVTILTLKGNNMLLLRCLVRDTFIKPASEASANKTTGEIIKAQPATPYAIVEHQNINNHGVPVLEMVNLKLVDQEAAFRAAVGKEVIVPVGHGQMNGKPWFNVPRGHLPTVQQQKAA
jgi:hypothetical protein